MGPQLERLLDHHSRSRDVQVRLSPRPQVFFRPEEVDGGSEPVAGPPLVLHPLPYPDHDALGVRPGSRRINRQLHGRGAVVAS